MNKNSKSNNMIGGLILTILLAACAASPDFGHKANPDPTHASASSWGVRLEGIRLAAAGHLVDFRYQVIDSDKAVPLMQRGDEAFLIDQSSGAKMSVPVTKVGQLRGTGTRPKDGRVYAVMFNNEGGLIHPGSAVTVVIGDFRAENLIVQ